MERKIYIWIVLVLSGSDNNLSEDYMIVFNIILQS